MRSSEFSAASIATLLRQQKIATLPELMAALGTDARRTVFRKLKDLSYRTSYSHRGRYYTLDDVAEFDELGLWAYEAVWFPSTVPCCRQPPPWSRPLIAAISSRNSTPCCTSAPRTRCARSFATLV